MASLARTITQFTQKEVAHLWQNARPVIKQDGFILLKAFAQTDFGRILIVIPKKVGTAPVRNKIRRFLKALFYENKLYQGDFDWIIVIKPPISQLPFPQLKKILLDVMSPQHVT